MKQKIKNVELCLPDWILCFICKEVAMFLVSLIYKSCQGFKCMHFSCEFWKKYFSCISLFLCRYVMAYFLNQLFTVSQGLLHEHTDHCEKLEQFLLIVCVIVCAVLRALPAGLKGRKTKFSGALDLFKSVFMSPHSPTSCFLLQDHTDQCS